jgi:hypothetical protein
MTITKYFDDYSQTINICLREQNFISVITVYRHVKMGTERTQWEPATVNWGACGAQPIAHTQVFSDAMKVAIEIATQMDSGKEISETYFQ